MSDNQVDPGEMPETPEIETQEGGDPVLSQVPRMPWERMDDEPAFWFRRFEAFRMLGHDRSVLGIFNQWRLAKSRGVSRSAPKSWRNASKTWNWFVRAEAWDQHLSDLAAAAIEAKWAAEIMGKTEVIGRLSDYGRNDMGLFFKVAERWTVEPLPSEEILEEEERDVVVGDRIEIRMFYRVRKVVLDMEKLLDPEYSRRVKKFTDSPKNGLGIELYSAKDAQDQVGKYHGLFVDRIKLEDVEQIQIVMDR